MYKHTKLDINDAAIFSFDERQPIVTPVNRYFMSKSNMGSDTCIDLLRQSAPAYMEPADNVNIFIFGEDTDIRSEILKKHVMAEDNNDTYERFISVIKSNDRTRFYALAWKTLGRRLIRIHDVQPKHPVIADGSAMNIWDKLNDQIGHTGLTHLQALNMMYLNFRDITYGLVLKKDFSCNITRDRVYLTYDTMFTLARDRYSLQDALETMSGGVNVTRTVTKDETTNAVTYNLVMKQQHIDNGDIIKDIFSRTHSGDSNYVVESLVKNVSKFEKGVDIRNILSCSNIMDDISEGWISHKDYIMWYRWLKSPPVMNDVELRYYSEGDIPSLKHRVMSAGYNCMVLADISSSSYSSLVVDRNCSNADLSAMMELAKFIRWYKIIMSVSSLLGAIGAIGNLLKKKKKTEKDEGHDIDTKVRSDADNMYQYDTGASVKE